MAAGGGGVANIVHALPPPYWVDEWEQNPQNNKSLSYISQQTKDKVRAIADHNHPIAGFPCLPDINQPWPKGPNEPIKGAVLGLVQSGKTAAMVGLISHLFDKGFDAVTVLTGTSNDLNLQTAIRLKNDVFDWGQEVVGADGQTILFCTSPKGDGSHKINPKDDGRDFFSSPVTYDGSGEWQQWTTARRCLRNLKSSLFVAKKNAQYILPRMRTFITNLNIMCQAHHQRPLRWAIIDDECDQVSTGGEGAQTPGILHEITQIGECAYIGFTATPMSNLLLPDPNLNPLFPEDFCAVLRSPHHWDPNSNPPENHPSQDLCYYTDSINKMYCGGWVFHNWCSARGIDDYFHVPVQPWDGETVDSATQVGRDFGIAYISSFAHYLVSGAARHLLSGSPNFPAGWVAQGTVFPQPHTMLVNPQRWKHAHWLCAEFLINLLRMSSNQGNLIQLTGPSQSSASGTYETYWNQARTWITDFHQRYRQFFQDAYNSQLDSFTAVDRVNWDPNYNGVNFPTFQEILDTIDILKNHIKLKVLNGETTGQDRLQFDEQINANTLRTQMPEDVYTIAIGGGKLGRGITLSGLCTTLFLTDQGADDNTVQMQRWFGYRGSHIEYIRVFAPNGIWAASTPNHEDGFSERNSTLADLLQLAADNETNGRPPSMDDPAWSMVLGPNTNPSNKVPGGQTFGFQPLYKNKFVTTQGMNPAAATHNMQMIDDLHDRMVNIKGMPNALWQHPEWANPKPVGTPGLGIFCGTPFNGHTGARGATHGDRFNADEIANFLDSLIWDQHNPGQNRHPIQIQPAHLPSNLPAAGVFHRSPDRMVAHTDEGIPRVSDPYLMAAWLKLWHYGHIEYTANAGPPNGIPLISQGCGVPAPEFNVIIREGGSAGGSHTFAGGPYIRFRQSSGAGGLHPVTGKIDNLHYGYIEQRADWGSDIRLDDIRDNWPTGDGWSTFRRSPRSGADGEPGLLIIYLIDDGQGGCAPAILMSVPDGGPSYRYI